MNYKWVIGIPLLFTFVLFLHAGWRSVLPTKASVHLELASPYPSNQPVASPTRTMLTPCELLDLAQLTEVTKSTYLPPRMSANQRVDGLLIQKCLWLATDEHLTPTITVTIISTENASPSAVTTYWQDYQQRNQSNTRFRSLDTTDFKMGFADSWGTHLKFTEAVVTMQASMPNPSENQATELRLLELSWPQLSKFYSSDLSSAEPQHQ